MMRGALLDIKHLKQKDTLILNILISIPMDMSMCLRYAHIMSFYRYKNQRVAYFFMGNSFFPFKIPFPPPSTPPER